MKKKDYIYILIIFVVGLMVALITKGSNTLYGSQTDWLSQHWALPEYFRTLFYETGELFPNFSPNIGGGQNIYNFSYYGLLNPIILISYLLPVIKMVDYIMISSILIVIASGIILYKWLLNNNHSSEVSLISSLIFMLANPIIFHSHRHIMFMNYIPFIILGLIGIDKYFNSNKKWLLIVSIFLMIMTSYFYSVGGLIVLGIYSIYKIIDIEKINFKDFSLKLIKIVLVMLLGVIMASIILLPTIGVIVNSRGQLIEETKLLSLFIPKLNPEALLYNPYSLGFTGISLISLIYGFFSKDKKTIILSLIISIIFFLPIFVYLLNGMLYVRYKVLIPFAPLVGLLIAHFLDKSLKKEIKLLPIFLIALIIGFINMSYGKYVLVYFLDIFIVICSVCLYYKHKKAVIIYIPLIMLTLINTFAASTTEIFVSKERYNDEFDSKITNLINETINQDNSYYRFNNLDATLSTSNKIYNPKYYQTSLYSSTYSNNYNDFFYDTFSNAIPYRNRVITAQSSNILFQTLMGVKYIGTTEDSPIGYRLLKESNGYKIYQNDLVFPLAYATNNIMSIDDYSKLEYPYRLEPLLNGVVANHSSNYEYSSNIKKIDLNYESFVGENIKLEKVNNIYKMDVSKADKIILKVNNLNQNEILIIRFKLLNNPRCSQGDIGININGINNVLTCKEWIYHNRNYSFEYILSNNEVIDTLDINLLKGKYEISDIETYVLNYNVFREYFDKIDGMEVDMEKTIGDHIYGNIKVLKDGYFVTTIPYDKGFTVTLNDQKVDTEIVNNGFLGFPISKGDYEVKIKFEAPLFKEGILLSSIGFLGFLGIIIYDYRKKRM
ncbi:MAG: YfhO family protein [Bacilli bacterium]|nr:YfhO family protein [Bacilli bacterium]